MAGPAPAPPTEDTAAALLRAVGQRVTHPRLTVLACLLEAEGEHLSADALLDQVAQRTPSVHRATIYRTLDGLTKAGVLSHVHLDRGLTAYHLATPAGTRRHHLHAQCSRCGTVTDLPAEVLGDTIDRIERISGFRLDPSHVAFSGLCAACSAEQASD